MRRPLFSRLWVLPGWKWPVCRDSISPSFGRYARRASAGYAHMALGWPSPPFDFGDLRLAASTSDSAFVASSARVVSVIGVPRSSRARDRQRRRQRLMAKLEGEDPKAVVDALWQFYGLKDGELNAVFRDGHVRKFEVRRTIRFTPADAEELDQRRLAARIERGLPPGYNPLPDEEDALF